MCSIDRWDECNRGRVRTYAMHAPLSFTVSYHPLLAMYELPCPCMSMHEACLFEVLIV